MAKTAVYGVESVTLANPGANGAYPSAWTGNGAFSFKAIVKDSLQFNDSAASDNEIEVEDSEALRQRKALLWTHTICQKNLTLTLCNSLRIAKRVGYKHRQRVTT